MNDSVREGWKFVGWTNDFRPILEKAGRCMAVNLDGEHVPHAASNRTTNYAGAVRNDRALAVGV